MNIRMLCMLVLLIFIAGCGQQKQSKSASQSAEELLEKGLIEALVMSSAKDRKAESSPALVAYIKLGYLHRKPDLQQDYSNYRFPLKSMLLLGHKVLLIDEEYITKYIGCCVSEGLAITVESAGPSLESFAKSNRCSIRNDPYLPDPVKQRLPKAGWFTLSCKADDAEL